MGAVCSQVDPHRRCTRSCAAAVFIAWSVLSATSTAQEPNPTIEEIKRVWKERQDKVRTARFDLDCKDTIHQGSASIDPKSRRKGTPDSPPRDYQVAGTAHVSFDNGKVRYSHDMPVWDPKINGLYQEHYTDVFDGQTYKSLDSPASGAHQYPLGVIRKEGKSPSTGQFSISPLFFAFRGDHDQFVRDLGQMAVLGRTVVGSRPCIEVVRDSRVDDRREALYLDAERAYVLVRKLTVEKGTPTWQLDVSYTPDSTVGWVPKSWSYIIRLPKLNRIIQSGTRTVTSYDVNRVLEPSAFDIQFPAGTRVLDKSSGKEVQYVIQEDGEKGREVSTRANPTYEQLQHAKPSLIKRFGIPVSAAIFVGALTLFLFLRWKRNRAIHRGVTNTGSGSSEKPEPA